VTSTTTIPTAHEQSLASVELEILRHKLSAITDEMAITLETAARSREVNADRDYAVAIVDGNGAVAALDDPLALGSVAATAAAVLSYFQFDMKDGDVVVVSDPQQGGTHVQDVTLLAPHVIDNEIILYLVARAHMSDMGGQLAGSYNPTAVEIWAEGVPIHALKLHRYARPVRDVVTTVLLNSRHPDATRGNLDALLAAIELGRDRIEGLVRRYGVAPLRDALTYTQDYAQKRAAAVVSSWSDGEYEATRLLDHDCSGAMDVAVHLRALVAGEALTLDFSGSAAQRPSFVNTTHANTVNFALAPVLARLGSDVPANSGVLRVVRVVTRPGTLVDATAGSPVGWAHCHPGLDVADAAAAAVASAAGDGLGALTAPAIHATMRAAPTEHKLVDLSPWTFGCASATAAVDGWGRPALFSRGEIPSVEAWELDGGPFLRSLELMRDTGGIGARRGAPAVEAVFDLSESWFATICTEGVRHAIPGEAGGGDGSPSSVQIEPATGAPQIVETVIIDQEVTTGRLRLRRGGGAGFGDPLTREVGQVERDIADGYVSADEARASYGVVLTATGNVDHDATRELREERTRRR
jgi:N-methylhydantoinase B